MKVNSPLVSIIIVHYNGIEMLVTCLKSVFKSNYNTFEVILVDNGSTDDSLEVIEQNFSRNNNLKIIRNSKNLGFTGGNNIGVKNARGKYIFLLNNDTVVDQQWIFEVVKVMESDYTIGCAQCKLLLLKNPKIFDTAGQLIDIYGFAVARGYKQTDKGQYDKVTDIFSACGAAMVIRKTVLNKLKDFFDVEYFCYHEDVDLCWRIWLRGYRTVFIPKAIVFHGRESSLSKLHKNKQYYRKSSFMIERNTLRTLLKNYSTSTLLKVLPMYLALSIIGFIFFIISFKMQFAIAEIKAYFWNILHFTDTWNLHLSIQDSRKISDKVIFSKMIKRSMKIAQINQLFNSIKSRYNENQT